MEEIELSEQEIEKVSYQGDLRFTSPGIAPSYIGDVLSTKYNRDWMEWSYDTLYQTINQDFHTEIHPVVKEKIQAVKLLLLTDDFWKEWEVFSVCVKAFNGLIPNFTIAEELTPAEIAWAIREANKIRQEEFSEEIVLYVQAICDESGLLVYPEELSFAQKPIGDREQVIKDAWFTASKNLNFPVEETEVGIQLARLNSIRHYIRAMQGEAEQVVLKYEKRW